MAGKVATQRPRVHRILDELSKNTWIEVAIDRAQATIGEEASDEAILTEIQSWLDPVLRIRNDKPFDLLRRLETRNEQDKAFITKREREREAYRLKYPSQEATS